MSETPGARGAPDSNREPVADQSPGAEVGSKGPGKGLVAWFKRLSPTLRWLVSTIAAAVVVLPVGYVVSSVQQTLSESHPLKGTVIGPSSGSSGSTVGPDTTEYGEDGFELLVKNPARIPPDIAKIDSCAGMWQAGRAAGAVPVRDDEPVDRQVEIKGNSETGSRIVAVRARVSRHVPTPDGVILVCPPEPRFGAPEEPLRINFDFDAIDLSHVATVSGEREGSPSNGEDVRQFEDGFSISLAKNESVQLAISTTPTVDDVYWYLEATVLAGGRQRTIQIADHGHAFLTPGRRSFDDYREGHSAVEAGGSNGPALDWGVDKEAKATHRGHEDFLQWRNVTIPSVPGLDVYVPHGSGNGYENSYRRIRHHGRSLILFNPPGVDPENIEVEEGGYCTVEGRVGKIGSVGRTISRTLKHGVNEFEHRSIDFECDTADGGKEAYRRESAHRLGSPIVFKTDLDPAATDQDRALAGAILRGIADNTE